jgi:putative PIN family toxin of toxin-antitoxin system
MRIVLDSNILVSALLVRSSVPGRIHAAWLDGAFTLLLLLEQLTELRSTYRKPKIAMRLRPREIGSLINNLDARAEMLDRLPRVTRSSDPDDNFLLAMAEVGGADYLVIGDKSGLLNLLRHKGTRIVTARDFASRFV